MIFLGTGAAELVPNPFCDCPVCQSARKLGKPPRKRSALLMDAQNVIDFGPEVMAASQIHDAPLYDLDNVFITHTHEDHLCFSNIEVLTMTPTRIGRTLSIYLSEKGKAWVERYIAAMDAIRQTPSGMTSLIKDGRIALCAVKPYARFRAGGMDVLPIQTRHAANGAGEYAVNYLFNRGAKGYLLYASDTGLYSEENYQALRGITLSDLVLEGTMGSLDLPRDSGHLCAKHILIMLEEMRARGIVDGRTRIYITHINQKHTFDQQAYQQFMDENAPQKVTVAYDGMRA